MKKKEKLKWRCSTLLVLTLLEMENYLDPTYSVK